MGISNTYTVRNLLWDINEDIIKPGDVVLVNLTEYGREWLLEDRPDMANFLFITWRKDAINRDQSELVKRYITGGKWDDKDYMRYLSEQALLTQMSRVMSEHGIRLVVLPGFFAPRTMGIDFENTFPTKGFLAGRWCDGQFHQQSDRLVWYSHPHPDLRLNHSTRDNHGLLAEAVYHSITRGVPLTWMPWK
jgi:hypothetical protein